MVVLLKKMTKITLNNSLNGSNQNPPGYNVWVGGKIRGDSENGAVKVLKGENETLTIRPSVLCEGKLLTWYFNYGWYSGISIEGPFSDGQTVYIPKIVGKQMLTGGGSESGEAASQSSDDNTFHLEGSIEPPPAKKQCLR
jgi:hypothetical protein